MLRMFVIFILRSVYFNYRNSAEAEAAVQAVADEAQAEMLLLGEVQYTT